MSEYNVWPSGIRDTTEFPNVEMKFNVSYREHLEAFCKMDGLGWNDYEEQRVTGNLTGADTRMRTYRKLYEKLGLIYKDQGKIRLSRLGYQVSELEKSLNQEKEIVLNKLRKTAIDILSRYQIKNPVDEPDFEGECDVLPCICIWKAMRQLDNKINYEEMNRVILRIMTMSDLEDSIEKIKEARKEYVNDMGEDSLEALLGEPVHTNQASARIAPWFSFAGWGGLIIEQQADADGYRHLNSMAIPIIDAVLENPPKYYDAESKEDWLRYYIGDAAQQLSFEEKKLSVEEDHVLPDENKRLVNGCNVLLYGVPGSGKSWTIEHEYCKKGTNVERLVFHPDYTYSDFIGQILPNVDEEGQVSYKFTPGPFTNILHDAYNDPEKEYILIIEEINRGNAPAIFGEVFQLLDRKTELREEDDDGYPVGTSEYGITNANIAKIVYGDARQKVRIPSNLSIIGTMNTSDQNVFTLDTAFQRRWEMRLIENNFEHVDRSLADAEILDTGVKWQKFCTEINRIIVGNNARMTSAEDKRLGAYFVHLKDLKYNDEMGNLSDGEYDALRKKEQSGTITETEEDRLYAIRSAMKQNRKFPEKVIKYLWDDAFKFNREIVFETTTYQSLEQVIRVFMYAEKINRFSMFKENVRNAFIRNEQ